MQIKSSIGLAVGPVDPIHWGQVLVLPNAYGIIEIEDPEGNAQQVGIGMLSKAGQLLSDELTSLRSVEEVADTIVNQYVRTLVFLVSVGNVVYLVLRGSGSVYVKRGGELASLMHQDGGISGEALHGDTFLLASRGFSKLLSRDELTGLFDHLDPAAIAEKLTLLLHEKADGEGSVALVFGVSEVAEAAKEEPAPIDDDDIAESEEESDVTHASTQVLSQMGDRIRVIRAKARIAFSLPAIRSRIADMRTHPRKSTALLAVFLGLFFIVSVVLGVWKQTTSQKNKQVAVVLSDAQHALDEGVALLELNPVKGRERLNEAKNLLEPLKTSVSERSTEGRKIVMMYRQITDNLTSAMQVVQSPLTLYYDVSLLKKGASASYMTQEDDTMIITDQSTNTVYQLNIASKNALIVGGGDALKSLSLVGTHGDLAYILTTEGVSLLNLGDKKVSQVIQKDDSWGAIISLVVFGGNVYLLDTQKSRIWKYVVTEKGFSEIREYLNPDTLPDLSQATSMAIDGSVWLGTANGKILRFTQGREDTFIPKGVEPALGMRLSVYTSDSTKNIYVLDTQNSRVVILDKDGIYLAQYQFTAAKPPTGLVVSEEEKKIFLLSDGKLFGIDLR